MKFVRPNEIEAESFAIIKKEMKTRPPEEIAPVLMRVIHTTADFEYEDSLVFSDHSVDAASQALCSGALIVTDTNMARSGINRRAMEQLGCEAVCFMADADVAEEASRRGVTRAVVSMERAAQITDRPLIFAIGNAPTALLRLAELIEEGRVHPALVIGVPVGFVNVVESKERMIALEQESIVARGRKGGSTVAAAIVNALLYMQDAVTR